LNELLPASRRALLKVIGPLLVVMLLLTIPVPLTVKPARAVLPPTAPEKIDDPAVLVSVKAPLTVPPKLAVPVPAFITLLPARTRALLNVIAPLLVVMLLLTVPVPLTVKLASAPVPPTAPVKLTVPALTVRLIGPPVINVALVAKLPLAVKVCMVSPPTVVTVPPVAACGPV
jgi:hypothetical protein